MSVIPTAWEKRCYETHRLILIQDSVRFEGWYAAPASRRLSMSPSVPPANASRRNSCTCSQEGSSDRQSVSSFTDHCWVRNFRPFVAGSQDFIGQDVGMVDG